MGMTIDEHIGVIEDLKSTMSVCMTEPEKSEICTSLSEAIDTMRKYQMFQAKYVERLKADMVAMLTDLKNKLIDKSWNIDMYDDDLDFECCYLNDIDEVIQQKINALKAESEGKK